MHRSCVVKFHRSDGNIKSIVNHLAHGWIPLFLVSLSRPLAAAQHHVCVHCVINTTSIWNEQILQDHAVSFVVISGCSAWSLDAECVDRVTYVTFHESEAKPVEYVVPGVWAGLVLLLVRSLRTDLCSGFSKTAKTSKCLKICPSPHVCDEDGLTDAVKAGDLRDSSDEAPCLHTRGRLWVTVNCYYTRYKPNWSGELQPQSSIKWRHL